MQPLPRDPWPTHLPAAFFDALDSADPAAAALAATGPSGDETWWQALVHALPDGVLALDMQLRCRCANPALQPLLRPGVTWQTIVGQSWHDVLADGVLDALLPWVALAQGGEAGQTTLRWPADDTAPPWTLNVRPLWDVRGAATGVLVLARPDTHAHAMQAAAAREHELRTRLQQQDAALATQQARWQALSSALRDAAIVFLDPAGRISDWPPSAERLLGYPAAAVVGVDTTAADSAAPQPLPPDTPQALERAALLGQAESTGWLARADGTQLWAHIVYTALHDADGQPLGTACLVRDMSAVHRLEALLRELNQGLERQVQERTQALQAALHDLEAFAYSVSHDLRAPLRHITAYLGLLREDLGVPVSDAVQEDLATIDEAAARMGQLIEGLLAFARLGRAALQRQPVPMLDLLLSSINRVQHDPALRRAPGEYELHLPATLPVVDGDPLLLSQVWDNLLGNAFKYSRPRHPAVIQVEGGVQPAAGGGQEAIFRVRDNGVGFDDRHASNLFGVFQRLHRPQEFEGTGIGLALCRRIVERHGGRIGATARPDAGATFWFTLPLASTASA
ncbi:sensor histidine kinase [Tepidimonas charontis]|uniref:histidine kinase n=1 Tax=Tepidimonas charontis TaxID=2267262 RepID=A0A554XDL4_9BURK|nr:ATP-binding protein [Tepidimonas charontis]TSE33930.1 Phytochrome-like protein cph1 [Tepidimonas charontis]